MILINQTKTLQWIYTPMKGKSGEWSYVVLRAVQSPIFPNATDYEIEFTNDHTKEMFIEKYFWYSAEKMMKTIEQDLKYLNDKNIKKYI